MLRAAVAVFLALGVSSTASTAVAQRMGFDRERVTVDKERDAIQSAVQNPFVTVVLFDQTRGTVEQNRRLAVKRNALPLRPQTLRPAEAACAKEQARLWRASRVQPASVKAQTPDTLQRYARQAGILDAKAKALDACLTSRKYGAQAGPMVTGARTMDGFQQVIAVELAKERLLQLPKPMLLAPARSDRNQQ